MTESCRMFAEVNGENVVLTKDEKNSGWLTPDGELLWPDPRDGQWWRVTKGDGKIWFAPMSVEMNSEREA